MILRCFFLKPWPIPHPGFCRVHLNTSFPEHGLQRLAWGKSVPPWRRPAPGPACVLHACWLPFSHGCKGILWGEWFGIAGPWSEASGPGRTWLPGCQAREQSIPGVQWGMTLLFREKPYRAPHPPPGLRSAGVEGGAPHVSEPDRNLIREFLTCPPVWNLQRAQPPIAEGARMDNRPHWLNKDLANLLFLEVLFWKFSTFTTVVKEVQWIPIYPAP